MSENRPLRIWLVGVGEPLPLEESPRLFRYGSFSKYLADRGHDVTWWSSAFSHRSKHHVSNRDVDQIQDGVRLKFLWAPGYTRNVSFGRLKNQRYFANRLREEVQNVSRPDVILAAMPTLESAEVMVEYGKLHRVPVLVDLRDYWPDEFVDMLPTYLRFAGRLVLASWFRKMCRITKGATGLVGISQHIVDFGLNYAGRAQRSTDGAFPHGYSLKTQIQESDLEDAKLYWAEQRLCACSDCFTICFFGTMGRFFDFETVIGAAAQAYSMPIRIVLCGGGSQLNWVREQVRNLELKNVWVPGWVDQPKLQALMKICREHGAGLACYAKGAKMSLPNKPFEYMAGRLPILSSIEGELSPLLEEFKFGVSYQGDSVQSLASAINCLLKSPRYAQQMGENGYRILEEKFESGKVFSSFECHLLEIVNRNFHKV